jgi:hypothetical protein
LKPAGAVDAVQAASQRVALEVQVSRLWPPGAITLGDADRETVVGEGVGLGLGPDVGAGEGIPEGTGVGVIGGVGPVLTVRLLTGSAREHKLSGAI